MTNKTNRDFCGIIEQETETHYQITSSRGTAWIAKSAVKVGQKVGRCDYMMTVKWSVWNNSDWKASWKTA